MAIASYRLYCRNCDAETVVRESEVDESHWSVSSLYFNEGVCPDCNGVDLSKVSESDSESVEIEFEELDHIGTKAAQKLREAGYRTTEDVRRASDDELLSVDWIGDKGLFSLKERVKQHPPQQRWNDG
jgi:DNA-directed RNA polymerase alpha subunit